jgi:hypothetical protein
MRQSILIICFCACAMLQPLRAQAPTPRAPARLPVRRVVLYKNGVGYFEHLGRVRGTQTLSIDFNSSQLNDVLKSLTTVDLANGRIADVSFNSDAPLARRLEAFALPIGDGATVAELLATLRGTRLEVRGGGRVIVGRLLGVEQRRAKPDAPPRDEVTVVSDAGELRSMELTPAVTVRFAERESAQQIAGYLGLLASARRQDRRTLTISAVGEGSRDVMVGYVSEVPVWKTTYRIVLPGEGRGGPMLQGWAIVDNTIGEDWNDVQLSLVAGAPQSFVQPLSQPVYVQRPTVGVSRTAMPEPQVQMEAANIKAIAPPPPAAPVMVGGSARGAGATGGVVGGLAETAESRAPFDRADVEARLAALQSAAGGQALGDLFEYRVAGPITIRKNQSALVPILSTAIAVERVSLWNERIGGARPLRSVWLTNSSGMTLDGGSFTVLEDATFAGEGLVEPMRAGEKRLLSFAVDLGVQIESTHGDEQQQVSRITIDRGIATVHNEQRSRKVYAIRNNDTSPRTIVVEHPIRQGWTLAHGVAPVETSLRAYRFAVHVGAKDSVVLAVDERRPTQSQVSIGQLDDRQLAVMARGGIEQAQLKEALRPLLEKKAEIASLAADLDQRQAETRRMNEDQQRLRENMRALKGSAGERQLLNRYVSQLEAQENRIAVLRRETDATQAKLGAARLDLAAMIERLSLQLEMDEAAPDR